MNLLKQSSDSILELLDSNTYAKSLLLIAGTYFLAKKGIEYLQSFFRAFIYNSYLNWGKRYGKGSYVLITGASDGIGKEFAFNMAKKGFNLIIIARNGEKLQKVAKEIKKLNENTQIEIVVADFSDSELKNYERIQSQIQHLNISILINNVGMAETGNFNELSPKILRNMILVNMLSQSLMTRMVIPGMLTRHSHNQHSLVIDLSSIAGTRPFPYLSMYAATKNFNSFLGQSLAIEYKHKIDWLELQPGVVETNMTKSSKQDSWDRISTDHFVKSACAFVPNGSVTSASWQHQLQLGFLNTLNNSQLKQRMIARIKAKKDREPNKKQE